MASINSGLSAETSEGSGTGAAASWTTDGISGDALMFEIQWWFQVWIGFGFGSLLSFFGESVAFPCCKKIYIFSFQFFLALSFRAYVTVDNPKKNWNGNIVFSLECKNTHTYIHTWKMADHNYTTPVSSPQSRPTHPPELMRHSRPADRLSQVFANERPVRRQLFPSPMPGDLPALSTRVEDDDAKKRRAANSNVNWIRLYTFCHVSNFFKKNSTRCTITQLHNIIILYQSEF